MSGENARLDAAEFENAMERSFLYWLSNEIPSVLTTGLTTPVDVVNCMPYEYYVSKRDTHVVLDVNFDEINTEGYSIGATLGGTRSVSGNSDSFRSCPWMYNIKISINAYCGSGAIRSKVDGKIRELFEQVRRGQKSIPVFEWVADTSAVTAYSTGANIGVMANRDQKCLHDQDLDNFDYLSHWMLNAKCAYVVDTTTELVTSFAITQTIENAHVN